MIRIIMFVLFSLHAFYLNAQFKALTVKHTDDFEVTGDGINAAWKNAGWVALEKRKGETDYKTNAKFLYSDTGLYVFFHCEDRKITATYAEDFADLYLEDVVELFLWTDESVPLYFEYEISPLNRELAILVPNFGGDFFGWTPWHYEDKRLTRHATKIVKDDKGTVTFWTAEVFIPYALLKPLLNVPPKKGSQWRINFYRIDYDNGSSSWVWNPVEVNFHDYKNFGVMKFD
ncbi:MAG TPA: carbohydrate-binding family 9-like protein [Cyclobacteriaceae bacterium]|nr:carbohydrate-binding family 9-like protein [Cyclobacteriaceae bacterium]